MLRSFKASTQDSAQKWYDALKRKALVTLTGLEQEFILGDLLGEGNYAKVRVGTKIDSGEIYAIKTVNKAKISHSLNNIVAIIIITKIARNTKRNQDPARAKAS